MTVMRDEAVAKVLSAMPTLDHPLLECMEMCDVNLGGTPEEVVRNWLMSTIREECAEEIAAIQNDSGIKEFSDFHIATLADFLMLGVDLFDEDERAAIAVKTEKG
jgi:hypothetical protein